MLAVNAHLVVGYARYRKQRDHEYRIESVEQSLREVKRVVNG